MAIKDKFRVVADGLPMQWPIRGRKSHLRIEEIYENVKPSVLDILHQNGISFQRDILCNRFNPPGRNSYSPEEQPEEQAGEETLVIFTDDTNTITWVAAARSILSFFQAYGAEQFVAKMQVEIRNPNEACCHKSATISGDVTEAHEGIQKEFSETVKALAPGSWSSIGYHTMIDWETLSREHGRPTAFVTFRPGTSCDFQALADRLQEILDSLKPLQIYLEFRPGQVMLL